MNRMLIVFGVVLVALCAMSSAYPSAYAYPEADPEAYAYPEPEPEAYAYAAADPEPEPCWGCRRRWGGGYRSGGFIAGGFIGGYRRRGWYG